MRKTSFISIKLILVFSISLHTEGRIINKEGEKEDKWESNNQAFCANLLPQHTHLTEAALLPALAQNFNSLQGNLIKLTCSEWTPELEITHEFRFTELSTRFSWAD